MKKAKIVLAAVLALAVVGGTFAFKAKNKFTGIVYYTATTSTVTGSPLQNATDQGGAALVFWTTVSTDNATNLSPVTTIE